MSLLKVNEVQNYNGSSLTLTASTVSTSAQLNTGGNISVTGSINVSDDSTTRSNLGLGSIATQASDNVTITGGNISNATLASSVVFPAGHIIKAYQATKTDAQTIASSTPTALTNLTVTTDTPASASSKFLLFTSIPVKSNAANAGTTIWFYRDSTKLGWPNDFTIYPMASGSIVMWSDSMLDSPASSSSIVYSVYAGTTSSTSMSFNFNASQCRFIVLEVAG